MVNIWVHLNKFAAPFGVVNIRETEATLITVAQSLDMNPLGNLFGGRMLEWMSNIGTVAATRFSRGPVVLAYLDRHFFLNPVRLGEVVVLRARIEYVGKSSMEVRISAHKESPMGGSTLITMATASYVAVDDYGLPRPLNNELKPADDEWGIFREAEERYMARKSRLKNRRDERFNTRDPTANLRWRLVSERWATPQDAFTSSMVSAGRLLAWMDEVAGILASRYCGGITVTGSVDDTAFYSPIRIGDIVSIRAGVTYVGRSSLEVMLNVIAEDRYGYRRHVCTAYYTLIHVGIDGKPKPVPQYIPSNDDEARLYREGELRRRIREEELKRLRG